MNFDYPVFETSESIEPNDNDLELNAIAYTFSKIFQPELKVPKTVSITFQEADFDGS